MLSTTDLLACHHDAKLPRPRAAHQIIEQTATRRGPVRFRPGLRVTVESPSGPDRRALVFEDA